MPLPAFAEGGRLELSVVGPPMRDMETCVKHNVPIIITSLRPPLEIVEATHCYGGVVFHPWTCGIR